MSRSFVVYLGGIFLSWAVSFAIAIQFVPMRTAGLIGQLAMAWWMLGTLVYVIVWDSRKRWPRASWSQRCTNVMTFRR